MSGVRGLETTIYEVGLYPFGYIGPVFVIWRAMTTAFHDSQPAEDPSATPKLTSKRKRKRAKKSSGEESVIKFLVTN